MPNPSKKQKLALSYLMDKTTTFVGYGGAAFGGKSYLLCRWVVTMCLAYPGTGWGIGRKQLTTLLKTTVITLYKVFEEMGLAVDNHFSYNGQLRVFTFTNDSQIFLIDLAYRPSDPHYTKLGGLELTGAAVDESVEVEEKAIEILFTRLGRRNNHYYGLKKKLLETFNPAKNHVYRRYYRPYKEGKLSEGYAFIPALPADNPSPEVAEYIADIVKNASRVTIERLINGNFEFEDDPTVLMDYEQRLNLFSNYHVQPAPQSYNRFLTCDIALAGSDKFVIYVWYGWVVIDIVTVNKSVGLEVLNTIKREMKKHRIIASNVVYDHDGVGAFIGGRGGFIPGSNGFVANARPIKLNEGDKNEEMNYRNLKAQCGYLIAKKVRNAEIFIQKRLGNEVEEEIIEDIGEIKTDGKEHEGKLGLKPKDHIRRDIGRSPDYGDAFLMRYLFEVKPRKGRRVKTIQR